jgi:O-antigen/teichoic acid export membrane protein
VRSWATLIFAMGLRVAASLCYLGLVALVTTTQGAASAAEMVYVFAVAYVSSNLGRFGADQQIAKSAPLFRRGFGLKAGSLVLTHSVFAVSLVPLLAALIHTIATGLIVPVSDAQISTLPLWVITLSAAGLSLGQTASAAWQAAGRPSLSVGFFPLLTYLILTVFMVLAPDQNQWAYVTSNLATGLLGISLLYITAGLKLAYPRVKWLRGNGYFYAMGVSFYITAWLPFVYLPGLLPAAGVVLLNVAVRLSAIQSLPSNAISGYLMPQFAVHVQNREHHKITRTMRQVIGITLAFQLVYGLALASALFFFPKLTGLDIPGLVPVLLILSFGQMINGLTGPVGPALLMLGQQRTMAMYSLSACVASAILGYIATQIWGAVGFALVVAFFVSLQNVIYIRILTKTLGINPYRSSSSE